MKTIINISIFIILTASLSSCAIHNGNMNNSASLNEANFNYIQQDLNGKSQTIKVLGIGGLGDDALVADAKKDMLTDIDLHANQALVNVTVNWKRSWVFFVRKTKCTVTADVVEFREQNEGI
ncbi:MAG: hypothetical protein KQH67_08230 [Bacteroidetes bacterium]|nr:hypothetical protein [Bacteroidota bacterium]